MLESHANIVVVNKNNDSLGPAVHVIPGQAESTLLTAGSKYDGAFSISRPLVGRFFLGCTV